MPRYYDSACSREHDRRFVHDYTALLPGEYASEIEGAACDVYAKTSAHFVLVTVSDGEGEPIESYALRLFEKWGIGQKDRNDGLLLLLIENDTTQGGGPTVRVEVGYGLEGAINARVANDAIDAMRDAKLSAIEAGEDERAALAFGIAVGANELLNALDSTYKDGSFPEPNRRVPGIEDVPPEVWITVIPIVISVVAGLASTAQGRAGRPGWGYHSNRAAWGSGLGRVVVGSTMRGGGLGGGGGFGGGRSGGGGGSGRL